MLVDLGIILVQSYASPCLLLSMVLLGYSDYRLTGQLHDIIAAQVTYYFRFRVDRIRNNSAFNALRAGSHSCVASQVLVMYDWLFMP
jgi:hypothetical protein